MEETYKLLFALLRKEICGETFSANIENITAEQYLNLYRISKSHDIAHIVGDALYSLNVGLETEIKSKFQKAQMMAIYRCAQMNYELEQLCTVFEKSKIPFMPLKGSIIRKYYAKPEMRTSCDIDNYVKESDLENATSVLISELGYKLGQKNIYDVSFYTNTIVHREFEIPEYPRSVKNAGKALVSEGFAEVRGDTFLRRVYADGSGELVRYNDEAEMWAILVFPANVESGIENKIRSSIRNNFDVGVCLEKYRNGEKAA